VASEARPWHKSRPEEPDARVHDHDMGKLTLRPTRRDAVVALAGMACVLLFSRMFELGVHDSSLNYTHSTPDVLLPTQKHLAPDKSAYKHQVVPQDDDMPKPAPVPVLPKRESAPHGKVGD
jgi:hypothetical protein